MVRKMKKLLLVIDMQNDFITGVLGNDKCREVVKPVIKRIQDAIAEGFKILCTKDTHESNYLKTGEGKRLPVEHCIRNTEGWEIIDEIKNLKALYQDSFLDIDPFCKFSFGSTELSKELEKYDFNQIEIIGVCTDICVISNAIVLRSDYPEIDIFVNSSCCAGVSVESHNIALAAMKACHISII